MHLVVSLDANRRYSFRDSHATQATGEGLLLDMGMEECPVSQHVALVIHDPPAIRVVIPVLVAMFQGHAHGPVVTAEAPKIRSQDLYIIGICYVECGENQKAHRQYVDSLMLIHSTGNAPPPSCSLCHRPGPSAIEPNPSRYN